MKNCKKKLLGTLLACIFISLMINSVINTTIISNLSENKSDDIVLNDDNPQQADDFIPTPPSPNDKLKWDFSNGTKLGFLYERYNDTEYSFGVHYYNITSMPYLYIDKPGMLTNFTYCVQLEEIYYDLTQNKIIPVQNRPLLNVSAVTLTESVFNLTKGFQIPMIPIGDGRGNGPSPGWFLQMVNAFIPMNDTELALNWSAQRLKIIYQYMMEMGEFDIESIDVAKNNIYFKNSTTGAYVNLTYYDNGTLLYGELYYNDGNVTDEDWWTITLTTIFDVNPIDDLEWDVEVGDCLYFGIERIEYKLNITSIYNYSYYIPQANTTFLLQVVNASLSAWSPYSEVWMSFGKNMTIGIGNELFPVFFAHVFQFWLPLILPMGYDTEKMAMMFEMIGEDWDQVAVIGLER